jgi:hypothetical protein
MTRFDAVRQAIVEVQTEEVREALEAMLAAHEAETEKRRSKAAEKRAEKLASEKVLEDGVLAVLGTEAMTASDIKDAVEGIETAQKATVIAKRLVTAGLVAQTEVKGKSGKVKGYTLA